MADKMDQEKMLSIDQIVSFRCYVSGCNKQAENKHFRGDYVIFICEDHNPSFCEGK